MVSIVPWSPVVRTCQTSRALAPPSTARVEVDVPVVFAVAACAAAVAATRGLAASVAGTDFRPSVTDVTRFNKSSAANSYRPLTVW